MKWENKLIKICTALVFVFLVVFFAGKPVFAQNTGPTEKTTLEETESDSQEPEDDQQESESNTDTERPEKRDWNEDGVLRILSIGNSFSVDCHEYLYDIIINLGINNVELGNLYISKASLDTHLNNAKTNAHSYVYYSNQTGSWVTHSNCSLNQIIAGNEWDYIVLQQSSPSSGIYESYAALPELIDIVEEMNPKARLAWNMTWSYDMDSSHNGFPSYYNSQDLMYYSIVSTVRKIMEENSELEFVIPVGTAIQNARTSYLGDTLTRDGHHLSYKMGRYIAGMTFAQALTGIDISRLTYQPAGVSTEAGKLAIESVKNAFIAPNQATKSQYNAAYRDTYYGTHPEDICIVTGGAHSEKTTSKIASLNYSGYKIKHCTVCNAITSAKEICKVTICKLSTSSYVYNGKVRRPGVIVQNSDGKSLKAGTDYSVTYAKGRKTPGIYAVTVTLKGNYIGTKELSFTIKPKGTSINKLTAGKKRLTVKWKKVSSQISGYEIQYAKKKNFQGKKSITVSTKKTSVTISKLAGKKKYYVRIRTFKTVNGKKYYSSWSKVKYVTTKK